MYLVSFGFYWPSKCGSYFCRTLYMHKDHICDASLHMWLGKHIKLITFIFKHLIWNFKNCTYNRNFRNGQLRCEHQPETSLPNYRNQSSFVFRMSVRLTSCRLKVMSECQLLSEHNSSLDNADALPTLQNFLYTIRWFYHVPERLVTGCAAG